MKFVDASSRDCVRRVAVSACCVNKRYSGCHLLFAIFYHVCDRSKQERVMADDELVYSCWTSQCSKSQDDLSHVCDISMPCSNTANATIIID